MTRHDSVSTFARSVVGGAVLFGMLFGPETPDDRRRREARALMFGTTPEHWRGWPGLSPTNYGTERGGPAVQSNGEGMCSDGLALTLAIFSVAIFVGILFAS